MKNRMLKGLVLSLIAGVFISGMTVQAKEADCTIAAGVYAEEVDLSGMTKEEAEEAIKAYVSEKSEETVTMSVNGETLEVSRGALGIVWDEEEVLEEAMALGKSGNLIKRYKEIKDLEFHNKVYTLGYTADKELVQTVVAEKCTKMNRDAVNVGLKKTESGIQVIDGKQGVVVDEANAVKEILRFIDEDFGVENTTIDIPTKITEPKGSAEELAKVKDMLGSF